MSKNRLSRRQFLRLSAGGAAGTLLAACAPQVEPTPAPAVQEPEEAAPEPTATTAAVEEEAPAEEPMEAPQVEEEAEAPAPSGQYNEAPMLASLVAAGDLPPVDQRLPANPRVLPVNSEVGEYGGTWRRAYKGLSDRWGPVKLNEQNAIMWEAADLDNVDAVPNYIEKWEQNDDASEFTFYLREGLKWSDGVEFTTDDVQFWYDYFYLADNNIQGKPDFLTINGVEMDLEVIDKLTWKARFAAPHPLLSIQIAKNGGGMVGGPTMAAPMHYFSQYIPDHPNGDQSLIDAAITASGVSTWPELFGDGSQWPQGPIAFWFRNPDLPVIGAWKTKVPPPADPFVMERNPYFFQVDEAGNQLPYIDEITHDLFEANDVFDLWVAEGRIDCQGRHTDAANFTFYKENEAAGNYKVYLWRVAATNALFPNIAHPDPVLRELFDTTEFREALSISINRDEINSLIYNGLLNPRQASPVKGSPEYDPEFEARWTEYDPERANALLDEMGLEEGSGGFRLRSDGAPLTINILHWFETGTPQADEVDLIVQHWQAIGINANSDGVERSLYGERTDANEVDVGYYLADRNSVVKADVGRYTGFIADGPWAAPYARWWLDSETGVKIEPPEGHPIREIWRLWDACRTEPDETKRNALFKQMLDIHKEHPYMIGTVGEAPKPYIVGNTFFNIPDGAIDDDTLRNLGYTNPQQYFMRG